MPRIGIIAGVRGEADILSPILTSDDAPFVRLSGARPSIAARQTAELINLGVDGILSFGSCGGTRRNSVPGSLIIAETVIATDGLSIEADKSWSQNLATHLGVTLCRVLGSDRMLPRADKASLGMQFSANAVDMESHIIAKLAHDAGVPFAVLRSVVDPIDFEIPAWVLDGVRADGSTSLLPIIAGLCIQPWTLGRMLTLQSYNKTAMEALGSAIRAVGPNFGFGGLAR